LYRTRGLSSVSGTVLYLLYASSRARARARVAVLPLYLLCQRQLVRRRERLCRERALFGEHRDASIVSRGDAHVRLARRGDRAHLLGDAQLGPPAAQSINRLGILRPALLDVRRVHEQDRVGDEPLEELIKAEALDRVGHVHAPRIDAEDHLVVPVIGAVHCAVQSPTS